MENVKQVMQKMSGGSLSIIHGDFKPMPLYIKRVEKDMDAVKLLYDQGIKYLDAMDAVLGKIRER